MMPRPRQDTARFDDVDLRAASAEARELAGQLLPRLERPQAGWRERRRRASAQLQAARGYLRNRRLDRAGREDLRPLYFIWTVVRACNFRCSYCDDHRGRRYPELPNGRVLTTAEGERLLRVMRTGTASVYFAGGEPTLRRDLPQLTRAARDLDYFPITINTNGSAIDRLLRLERWRSWLADTDIVVVSLDGLDPARLGSMWGYRKPLDVIRNLMMLRELAEPLRFKLMVNTVIQPGQIDMARDVLDFANAHGIWFCPVPVNVGPSVERSLFDDPDYDALVALILERKRAGYPITGSLRMNRRLLRAAPLDCRNLLKPHVDADGGLWWPCKASVNVEPIKIDVLAYEHLDALYAAACRRIDPTRFQGPGADQCGASCNWAQNYTTDAYVDGLRHPARLVRDVAELVRAA